MNDIKIGNVKDKSVTDIIDVSELGKLVHRIACLPATTASPERSFNVLKRLIIHMCQ